MSQETHVGGECDDRTKGYSLRMGGPKMDWDVVLYDKFMYFHPPEFDGGRDWMCVGLIDI